MFDTSGLVKFITGVRFSKKNLQQLNAITFLFDPNWEMGIGNTATFPMSIFYVVNVSEMYETEVSQKQLIFNGGSTISSKSVTSAQTSIIADNIVVKPKTYKLQILIPLGSVSTLQVNSLNAYQQNSVYTFLSRGSDTTKYVNILGGLRKSTEIVKMLFGLLEDIMYPIYKKQSGKLGYNIQDLLLNITDIPSYNKDSLEAMWRNRSILKMKMWNDWRYKYVVIRNLEMTKEGTSNDICEGTLTVQEMPIMTVRPRVGTIKKDWVGNPIVQGTGELIKQLINSMESKEL